MSNGVQGNYVSDASILAWVTKQQDMQYGQLQAAMNFESTRGEMLQELANLKSELRGAAKNTDGMSKLNDDIQSFLSKYGEVSDFEDIANVVKSFASAVDAKVQEDASLPQRLADYQTAPVSTDSDGNPIVGPEPTGSQPFSKDEVEGYTKSLDELGDTSNHNEQLGMIRINEIKSTIDHSAEVASQLIKSSNDTSAFAINNIA
jgi:hypothetical protein